MAVDGSRIVRLYLSKLVDLVVPQELGTEFKEVVLEELNGFQGSPINGIEYGNTANEIVQQTSAWFETLRDANIAEAYKSVVAVMLRYMSGQHLGDLLMFLNKTLNGGNITNLHESNDNNNFSIPEDTRSAVFGMGADSFENINFDRQSDRRSIYSTMYQNNLKNDSRNYTLQELSIPYFENHLKEEDILKYICYTLIGSTSNLFPIVIDKEHEKIEISITETVSNGECGILHLILEAGLIYTDLKVQIENLKKVKSPTKIAMLSFINDELNNYVRFVNSLSMNTDLTLHLIYAKILDYLIKLRFLKYSINQIKLNKLSHEILFGIYNFQCNGDSVIRDISIDMFNYIVEPFVKKLVNWLIEGELNNDEDFFITGSKESIELLPNNVPKFISSEISEKIYLIGKMLLFLKKSQEFEWLLNFSNKYSQKFQKLDNNLFQSGFEVDKIILNQYNEILNYFNYTICKKFNILSVINCLKRFMLMSQGDFMNSLIDFGTEALSEPSTQLNGYQLTNMLSSGIENSTVRYTEKSLLNNLDATLLEVNYSNIGWDVFTLEYNIPEPLDLILDDENHKIKKNYLKIFNYLWKLKRIDKLFESQWIVQKQLKKHDELVSNKLQKIRLIKDFMNKFIKKIENYIFTNIIEKNYNEFFSEITSSGDNSDTNGVKIDKIGNNFKVIKNILKPNKDYLNKINEIDETFTRFEHELLENSIDELQSIHKDFLNKIINHKLINGTSKGKVSSKYLINQMNSLINNCFKFLMMNQEFYSIIQDQFTTSGVFPLQRFQIIYKNLMAVFQEFNSLLKVFINDLGHDEDVEIRMLGNLLT